MFNFCGINFKGLTLESIFNQPETLSHIVTVNAEYIVKANEDVRFLNIVNNSVATFDGQVPYIFAKMINLFNKFPYRIEKISGSVLIYSLCERALAEDKRIFLLGGEHESNQRSVDVLLSKYPGLKIKGYSPIHESYPFTPQNQLNIAEQLEAFLPDYLLVGFGVGKQDYWINDQMLYLKKLGVILVVGVGGTFEMVSGKYKRAPIVLQKLCLEGIYRFVNEPKLFRFKRLLTSLRFFRYIFTINTPKIPNN